MTTETNIDDPFDPPEYDLFVPTVDLINKEGMKSRSKRNKTANMLVENSWHNYFTDDTKKITKILEESGYRKLSGTVRSGVIAIVFEGPEHQMLRLVHCGREKPRPDLDMVLQPVEVKQLPGNYKLEILPRVQTLEEVLNHPELAEKYHLSDPHAQAKKMIEKLIFDGMKQDLFFYDVKYDNIALIQDKEGKTVPLILDAGAIRPRNKMRPKEYEKFARHWLNKPHNAELLNHMGLEASPSEVSDVYLAHLMKDESLVPPIDYKEAQQAHLERLGLDRGCAQNVITNEQLAEFLNERKSMARLAQKRGGDYNPKQSTFAKMVEDGLYPAQIGKLVEKAANNHEEDQKRNGHKTHGFCHHLNGQRLMYKHGKKGI